MRLNRRHLLAVLVLLLGLLRSFRGTLDALLLLFSQLLALLASQWLCVVRLEPLTEWDGIDGDDGTLDESLGADQLVVGGVVDRVNDAGLPGASLNCRDDLAEDSSILCFLHSFQVL
jgi:hypothetical protein